MSAQLLEASGVLGIDDDVEPALEADAVHRPGDFTAGRADELEDVELVRRVSLRDTKAFEILYGRYQTPLRRFIYRVNRRIEQVEEIINDVMMVVWQKAETFNRTSKVSTWIMGIAYNKVLNAGSKWTGGAEVDFDEVEAQLPGVVDQGMREYELQDWLTAALERLSPEQRAVMELTCVQGLHYDEIAEILGCPENTVKTRMFHARKKLRQIIPEIGMHDRLADLDRR